VSPSEASLRDRIKNLARTEGKSVNEVLKRLYLERFLTRLSRSAYANRFVFKGGNLLAYLLEIGRETKDLDFLLIQLAAEESVLVAALRTIAEVEAGDGFQLRYAGIEPLAQAHMNHPGYRVTLDIRFKEGTLRDRIQVDLGVGDPVEPEKRVLRLLSYREESVFEPDVNLLVYPAETIYAEKLEAVVSKGGVNSRMKDFHDLLLMGRNSELIQRDRLVAAIRTTFRHRGTELRVPIYFSVQDTERLQVHWGRHLRSLGAIADSLGLPTQIDRAVQEINEVLLRKGV
jgi:predicted nucleotidyltransferase component of viral defense system